ncbi:hypothetical protein [Longispora albida]|uniref:hypothetical protein n=1 Tax=Longispora albida TaxID=203523 RepID=UPI0003608030|nr:hypothetical protein [Longispora albida]
MSTLSVFLVLVVIAAAVALVGFFLWQRQAKELADARAEAMRWYDRLGGQVMNLHGEDTATRQALADAGERYNAAGAQLEQSKTARQFELAGDTALEGLAYVRAARIAMGLDPGPDLPELAGQRRAGVLTKERRVEVQGQVLTAGPSAGPQTPYYYPGGTVSGRPVPGGWYSTPWWKTALIGGAGAIGTMLIFDALFSPAFADPGYDAYAAGYDSGFGSGYQEGLGSGTDDQLGDAGGGGGYDGGGFDSGGYDGDFGGDF